MEGNSSIKPAFLFLMCGDHNLPEIWQEFFDSAETEPCVWVHAKDPGAIRTPLFRQAARVETLPTRWGHVSLVRATLRLLRDAFDGSDVTHFALLSESCVPVKPLPEIIRRLSLDGRSRIGWKGVLDMMPSHRARFENSEDIPLEYWTQQHQWMVLDREAAAWVLMEDHTKSFEDVFAADEHYFATVLAMTGYPLKDRVRNEPSTWVDWRGGGGPTAWSMTNGRLALDLMESPAFFARKFARDSDIGRFGLHRADKPHVVTLTDSWCAVTAPRRSLSEGKTMLVAACSCRKYPDRRQACRETWASVADANTTVRFFVGGGGVLEGEPDTVVLDADDTYETLPGKVMAFFRHALKHEEFDWLFKCDDDTYVDISRLWQLAEDGVDMAGSAYLMERGAPTGGAGYLLSRRMVEKLVAEGLVPGNGDEDVLIGREAFRLGARVVASGRLLPNAALYPRLDNDLITAHYCGPERMRAVHTLRHALPVAEVVAVNSSWRDTLLVYGNGVFARKEGMCAGLLRGTLEKTRLDWFDWKPEMLVPPGSPEGFEGDPNEHWLSGEYLVRPCEESEDDNTQPVDEGMACHRLIGLDARRGYPAGNVSALSQSGPAPSFEDAFPVTVGVSHASWFDEVELREDGRFVRASAEDGGSFVRLDDCLTLKWDRWKPERFVRMPDGRDGMCHYCLDRVAKAFPIDPATGPNITGKYHGVSSGWVGPVTLLDDGVFAEGLAITGRWTKSEDGGMTLARQGSPPDCLRAAGSGYKGKTWHLVPCPTSYFGMWRDFDPNLAVYRKLSRLGLIVASPWGECPVPCGCCWDVLLSGENIEVAPGGCGFMWDAWGRTGEARWFVGPTKIADDRAFHLPHFYDYWSRYARIDRPAGKPRPGISFVATNSNHRRRIEVARELSRWFPVVVSSGLRAQFADLPDVVVADVPRTLTGKLDFIADFTFNLCFENSVARGYLTEKPFQALWAGTVPLYEGDPDVADWIDPDAMVDCVNLHADEIADRIREAERAGIPEWVREKRVSLIKIGLEDMIGRFEAFLESLR
ncbi:MAG: hypothetical protein J0M04_09940 [Verrucomicrobia bacterium]|nr:hypothetical protein [Verrucomicrobiota bacterium]